MKNLPKLLSIAVVLVLAGLSFGQRFHAKITVAQAKKAALSKYHGKLVGKVPLENEDGKWQYAVTVRTGGVLREVMVDATTGKIASVEITTAREEAKEAAAEKSKAKKRHKK
jgi:hypothetical protein